MKKKPKQRIVLTPPAGYAWGEHGLVALTLEQLARKRGA